MIEKLGGRKFIFALLSVLLLFVLVVLGKILPETFVNAIEIIGGTYVIGNIATKITE